MFTICVNENNYYTTDNTKRLVKVEKMPDDIKDVRQLKAYKYNEETKLLEVDETKLAEIDNEIANEVKIPTESERLADLETAFLELSMMMLGGE